MGEGGSVPVCLTGVGVFEVGYESEGCLWSEKCPFKCVCGGDEIRSRLVQTVVRLQGPDPSVGQGSDVGQEWGDGSSGRGEESVDVRPERTGTSRGLLVGRRGSGNLVRSGTPSTQHTEFRPQRHLRPPDSPSNTNGAGYVRGYLVGVGGGGVGTGD